MPFITNTLLRSLSYATFAEPEDGAVFKKIPGTNQDGSTGGVEKQVTARVDDTLRMSRLLVGDFRKKDDLVVTDPQTKVIIDRVERNRGTNSRTQAGNKFLANLALINQQATLAKVQKRDFTGLGSTVLDGAKDIAKTVASTLAQVPVAGTGVHFVNGGKVGKEYLKGGGNAVGNFLRNVTGTGEGLQGHESVLSGQPILINKEGVDTNENGSLLRTYKAKIENEEQRAKPELTSAGDSNLRQPYKNRNNPGTVYSTRLKNQKREDTGIDKINESTVFDEKSTRFMDLRNTDIIPFEFQIFDPAAGGTPKYLLFRAYLTQLQDSFSGEWSSTKYIGRAEPLFNYTGFNRGFSFGFNLAAHTIEELKPLYKKLNYLVSSTAPSYSNTFMRGVFTKVTIGDYLSAVPGFFTNIDVSWNTNYPWEIGIGEQYEALTDTIIVPHLLDITLQFQPVHDFNPAIDRPFIGTENQSSIFDSRQGPGLGTFQSSNNDDVVENQKAQKVKRTKFGKFLQEKSKASPEQGTPEVIKTINIDGKDTNPGLNYIKYEGFDSAKKDLTSLIQVDPFDPDSTSPDTGPTPNNAGSVFDVPSSNFA